MRNSTIAAVVLIALALAACGQGQSQTEIRGAAAAAGHGREAGDAGRSPTRTNMSAASSRSSRSRCARASPAISRRSTSRTGRSCARAIRCSPIDRRPFETTLAQAQASLDQAKANLAFAEADLQRALSVAVGTVITQQTLDQRTQARRVAQANVAAQEQAVRQASLDLEFTELRAPVDGRIGDRRVSVGNLVTGGAAGTTLLATIELVDPIRFEFTLDEGSYLRYARLSKDKADAADRGLTVPVRLKLIDETSFVHVGRLDFVDNAISRSTGTIRARAVFANPDRTFTPGMFARVQMAAAPPADTLLVPEAAIGAEQARKFVLVVDADNVARPKYVTLGPVVDGLRVVAGIAADDNVIVNGLIRARPGAKVAPHQQSTPARPPHPPRRKVD